MTDDLLLRRQARLLDLSREAILVRDEENRVLFWNATASLLYGWPPEEAIGRSVHQLICRDDARFIRSDREGSATGTWSGELPGVAKDGRELRVQARWERLLEGNGASVILMVHTDVSEAQALQAQILRTQRL